MRWLIAACLFMLLLLAWGACRTSKETTDEMAVKQPIDFPHKKHIEAGLQCTNCHQRAEKGSVAGRPPISFCMACHTGGKPESPELKKLQAYSEKGHEVPWKRVWRLPSHVFFPHRTHVVAAKVECQTCHGPMETLEHAPTRPLKTLSMNDCIDCHEKHAKQKTPEKAEKEGAKHVQVAGRHISNDCLACHR
jgi:hypothetical protein